MIDGCKFWVLEKQTPLKPWLQEVKFKLLLQPDERDNEMAKSAISRGRTLSLYKSPRSRVLL